MDGTAKGPECVAAGLLIPFPGFVEKSGRVENGEEGLQSQENVPYCHNDQQRKASA